MADREDDGFLSRWSRRKVQVRQGAPVPELPLPPPAPVPPPAAVLAPAAAPAAEEPAPAPPPPTLEEALALGPDSDFRRFVTPDVAPDVRNAALKQLFADPHYNLMDGLDIYIDDYGRPDPIPESMLRKMAQAQFLNLFADEPEPPPPAPPALPEAAAPDEDPDLRLQPHDAAGPDGPEPGAGEDPGREP
jgi:hypothetical protein